MIMVLHVRCRDCNERHYYLLLTKVTAEKSPPPLPPSAANETTVLRPRLPVASSARNCLTRRAHLLQILPGFDVVTAHFLAGQI